MAVSNYEDFKKKLAIGHYWEVVVQKKIVEFYNNRVKIMNECTDNKYDFMMSDGTKYEVKYDAMSLKTGNVFVEIIQFNKPSGLHVTIADKYIFVLPTKNADPEYIMIDVVDLKKVIECYDHRYYSDKFKGGYLVHKTLIRKHGIDIS
jgi:hypothetical protein